MTKIILAVATVYFAGFAMADSASLQDVNTYACISKDASAHIVHKANVHSVDAKTAISQAIRDFKIGRKASGEFFYKQPAKCGFSHESCISKDVVISDVTCN